MKWICLSDRQLSRLDSTYAACWAISPHDAGQCCLEMARRLSSVLYYDSTLISASRILFCVSLNFRIPKPRKSPYGTHIKLLYGEGSSRSAHKKITTVTQVNAEAFITKDRSFGPFVFLILKYVPTIPPKIPIAEPAIAAIVQGCIAGPFKVRDHET